MKNGIRILLVDDHGIVRRGLRSMLEQEEDMEVVGEADNAGEALAKLDAISPNIVLMDVRMPGMDGIEACRRLKTNWMAADMDVIMLTLYQEYLVEALKAGAAGYLAKDVKREELIETIREVYRQQTVKWDTDILLEEAEIVIPSHTEATQFMSFIQQIEHELHMNIMQTVGSRDRGTSIIIQPPRPIPLANVVDKIKQLPMVQEVQDKPAAGKNPLRKRTDELKLKTNSRHMILVTLKPENMMEEKELAGVGMDSIPSA